MLRSDNRRHLQIPPNHDLITTVPRIVLIDQYIVMARFLSWERDLGVVFFMDLAVGLLLYFY